jgi:hypothetical protein
MISTGTAVTVFLPGWISCGIFGLFLFGFLLFGFDLGLFGGGRLALR